MMESHHIGARTFFGLEPLTENSGRVYLLSGRGAKLANLYLSLGISPEDFQKLAIGDGPEHFLYVAPLVAIALKENGHLQESSALLALGESKANDLLTNGQPLSSVLLARIYAVQGRKEDALGLLASAVSRGWLPQPPDLLSDLHSDPAFASLKGEARFEKLREHILGTIARERSLVDQRLLHQLSKA